MGGGKLPFFSALVPILPSRIVVVERVLELACNEFLLVLHVVIYFRLPGQVELILVHHESVFSDCVASFTRVALHEGLLVDLADWDAMLVSDDASITDLLVDCGVMDECCRLLLLILLLEASLPIVALVPQKATGAVASLVQARPCSWLSFWRSASIARAPHELVIHLLHLGAILPHRGLVFFRVRGRIPLQTADLVLRNPVSCVIASTDGNLEPRDAFRRPIA